MVICQHLTQWPMLSKAVASQQDHKSLKQGLGNQEKWENEWEMPFHPDSCVIYSFSPSDQKQDLAPHIVIHSFSPCAQEQDLAPHIHPPLIPVRDSQHYQVHGCHYPERHRMGQTCVVNPVNCKGRKTLGFLQRNLKNGISNN